MTDSLMPPTLWISASKEYVASIPSRKKPRHVHRGIIGIVNDQDPGHIYVSKPILRVVVALTDLADLSDSDKALFYVLFCAGINPEIPQKLFKLTNLC